jgi:alpha-D-glucose phosphate-specific phosphoglucomutase
MRSRENASKQQHDRPCCRETRTSVVRSASGFQVVCVRTDRCSICFGGEESAGASFLRRNGEVWTTDRDGLIMDLLAAEITARTGKDPGLHYRELTAEFASPIYTRIDAPASHEQKRKLQKLSSDSVKESQLAGEPIVAKLTKAPGNHAPIAGLRWVRDPAGSRLGHPEPKTSTRSMPRASKTNHI